MQSLEPPWLNVPTGQAKHSVERAVPLYIPAEQSTHVLLISYRPAMQSVHAPESPETTPEAHGLCWANASGTMSTTATTTHPRFPRDAADEAITDEATPGSTAKARTAVVLRAPFVLGEAAT